MVKVDWCISKHQSGDEGWIQGNKRNAEDCHDDLEALWMKIMERPTPQTSPVSSEGEESDDDEAEAFEADAGRSQAL